MNYDCKSCHGEVYLKDGSFCTACNGLGIDIILDIRNDIKEILNIIKPEEVAGDLNKINPKLQKLLDKYDKF